MCLGNKGKAAAMVAGSKKRKRLATDDADEEMKEMEKDEIADLTQQNEDLRDQVKEMQKVLVSL